MAPYCCHLRREERCSPYTIDETKEEMQILFLAKESLSQGGRQVPTEDEKSILSSHCISTFVSCVSVTLPLLWWGPQHWFIKLIFKGVCVCTGLLMVSACHSAHVGVRGRFRVSILTVHQVGEWSLVIHRLAAHEPPRTLPSLPLVLPEEHWY